MADFMDDLKALDTSYGWLHGAKDVGSQADELRAGARDFAKLFKSGDKIGKDLIFDPRQFDKLLGSRGKAATGLAKYWRDQQRDLCKALPSTWPAVDGDPGDQIGKLMKLDPENPKDAAEIAKSLSETVAKLEAFRDALRERESYAGLVVERMGKMEKAHEDVNEAANEFIGSLDPLLKSLKRYSDPNYGEMREMTGLQSDLRGMAGSVARAYSGVASKAEKYRTEIKATLVETERALKRLYEMQGEKLLRGAKDFLGNLLKV